MLDDESDNDRSDYESYDMCYFSLHFDDSIGRVSALGFGVFVPTGVESNCDVLVFFVSMSIIVELKVGRLIKNSWCSNY